METSLYGTPELTELGVLNVDTLSGSGRGGRRRKPTGRGGVETRLVEIKPRGGGRDDNGDMCDKIKPDSDKWEIYCANGDVK